MQVKFLQIKTHLKERNHTSSIYNRTPTSRCCYSCCCFNACACLRAQNFYLFTFLFCSQNRTPFLSVSKKNESTHDKYCVPEITRLYLIMFVCFAPLFISWANTILYISSSIFSNRHAFSLFCLENKTNSFVFCDKKTGTKHFLKMNGESIT